MTSEDKNNFLPNTSDLIVQIALLLIGLALAFGAANFVDVLKDSAATTVNKWIGGLQFFTIFIVLVVWLHAEIAYGAIETYTNRTSITYTVTEYWLEILNLVFPVFAALNVGAPLYFAIFLILIYLSDTVLALFTLVRQRFEGGQHPIEYQTCQRWLVINTVTALVILIILVFSGPQINTILPNILIFAAVLVSSILDYIFNKTFYFGDIVSDPEPANN